MVRREAMTVKELQTIVDSIGYKQNARLKVHLGMSSDSCMVYFSTPVTDVRDKSEVIHLTSQWCFQAEDLAKFNKEIVIERIWKLIKEHELHEAMEWFTYKGEQVYDPHPRDK